MKLTFTRTNLRRAVAVALAAVVFAGVIQVPSLASAAPAAPGTLDPKRVIDRARSWTDKSVPYSQTRYKGGYRTDCSGFVSMAWDLPVNVVTWNVPLVAKRIGKDDLRAGDVLLNDRGGVGGRHVVIFEKWADAGKTTYVALEQTGGKDKAVRREIPYPYDFDEKLYKPYRYAGMERYEREIPKRDRQLVDGWAERKAAEERVAEERAAASRAAVSPARNAPGRPDLFVKAPQNPALERASAGVPETDVLDRIVAWLGV